MFAGVAFPECFKSPGYMTEHLVVAIGNVSGFGYPDKPVPVETTVPSISGGLFPQLSMLTLYRQAILKASCSPGVIFRMVAAAASCIRDRWSGV